LDSGSLKGQWRFTGPVFTARHTQYAIKYATPALTTVLQQTGVAEPYAHKRMRKLGAESETSREQQATGHIAENSSVSVPPPNARFPVPTQVHIPNGISISSAVLAQLIVTSNRQTDAHTGDQ